MLRCMDGGGLRQFTMFRERRQAWEKEILSKRGWQAGLVCVLVMREVCGPWSWGESSGKQIHRHCCSIGMRRKPLGRGCEAERWSTLVSGCGRHSGEACMSSETPDYKLWQWIALYVWARLRTTVTCSTASLQSLWLPTAFWFCAVCVCSPSGAICESAMGKAVLVLSTFTRGEGGLFRCQQTVKLKALASCYVSTGPSRDIVLTYLVVVSFPCFFLLKTLLLRTCVCVT